MNNLARTKQLYRPIATNRLTPATLTGLKAVIYTDAAEPPPNVRKQILAFVNAGGMLITGPAWGSLPNGSSSEQRHPRFTIRAVGSGAVALAPAPFVDPYIVPNDAVVLVSHRHDLLRFWNCGAITPSLSTAPGQHTAALRIVFYSQRPVQDATVWVKGSYRSARIRTWNQQQPQNVKLATRDNGSELYLPPVAQYAQIDFEG